MKFTLFDIQIAIVSELPTNLEIEHVFVLLPCLLDRVQWILFCFTELKRGRVLPS